MSVLIKGMEMPTSCDTCPFCISNKHDRGDDSLCRASGKEAKCGCPLVPVPPHGRLIDADELCAVCRNWVEDNDGIYPDCSYCLAHDAPTIIPADKEETE